MRLHRALQRSPMRRLRAPNGLLDPWFAEFLSCLALGTMFGSAVGSIVGHWLIGLAVGLVAGAVCGAKLRPRPP